MRLSLIASTIIIIVIASANVLLAAPDGDNSMTPVREVMLPEITVICKDFQTSRDKAREDFTRELTAAYAALRTAGVSPTAGAIMVFPPQEMDQNWQVQVAIPVAASTKAPAGYAQRVLAGGKAESMVYHGDGQHVDKAFIQFHAQLESMPGRTSGEIREHVLNWVEGDSPNTVLLLEAPHAE